VLDTWFSSGLWPFSTLGWPEKTQALQTFYPTSILETGFDIIFFWVARMIMMGTHFMGEVPFKKVYLHAMVRDEKGEKMSKSKGNVIDPLVLIEAHGADPLRFTLAAMAGQGRDIKLSVDRVEGYRAFCNKLWNATKFFHLQLEEAQGGAVEWPKDGNVETWLKSNRKNLRLENRWILSRLERVLPQVQSGLENFELNTSAAALYDFSWGEFCDWYIEYSKISLREGGAARLETIYTLRFVTEKLLTLLHPFMPFVTERLWQTLPGITVQKQPGKECKTLMLKSWPKADSTWIDENAEKEIRVLSSVIEAIRNFRGENNLSPKIEFEASVSGSGDDVLKANIGMLLALARLKALHFGHAFSGSTSRIPIAGGALTLTIPTDGLVNFEEEAKRVSKELATAKADLSHVQSKLTKESFIAKAPPELVAKEKAKEAEYLKKIADLEAALLKIKK
jgi:valyl-tRNA synthetase